MAKKIVILEDNMERRSAMARCLEDRFYQFERCFFVRADAAVTFLKNHLPDTILISLDHDLEIEEDSGDNVADPGTGREVADFLVQHGPVCPVILHSTNSVAVAGMERVLAEAGWQTHRVVPCDDLQWIPTTWFRSVRRAIVTATMTEQIAKEADRHASGTLTRRHSSINLKGA